MIKLPYTQHIISPKLLSIVEALNINVFEYSELHRKLKMPAAFFESSMGVYNWQLDVIGLNEFTLIKSPSLIESVLLHEIGHWSGHRTRTGRQNYYTGIPSDVMFNTEEIIAQRVGFSILKQLDLANGEAIQHNDSYLSKFVNYNPTFIEQQCDIAKCYIVNSFNNKKAA